MIYVWALEQKSSRRGWDEGGEQDVMVPWVMTAKKEKAPKKKKQQVRKKADSTVHQGAEAVIEAEERKEEQVETQEAKPEGDKTYLRYYHLYRKGELENDIEQAGGSVVESGYEKDNWWAIANLTYK